MTKIAIDDDDDRSSFDSTESLDPLGSENNAERRTSTGYSRVSLKRANESSLSTLTRSDVSKCVNSVVV